MEVVRERARRPRQLAAGDLERAAPGRRAGAGSRLPPARRAPLRRRHHAGAQAYDPALQYELDRIERRVNRPHRDASLRLQRRTPVLVAARTGRQARPHRRRTAIVQALASLERPLTVTLPVKLDPPDVATADLRPVAAEVRRAVSAPVILVVGRTKFSCARTGSRTCSTCRARAPRSSASRTSRATRSSTGFAARPSVAPRNADFAPTTDGVRLVPSRLGSTVDVAASGRALLRAALSPTHRVARLVTRSTKPKLTTAKARTLGIREIVGSYTTIYGGIANRIHNVQLVAHLIDHHYIAPGEEFSFNKTTGARDASKGFLEAPVIINGELQTGLGGGVCQVSTTVFNAAYEAGLKITARTNHALYISHYPLGRDATVNYPDTRPAVRQRHEALAPPAHVRRLVVADREPLRDEPPPQGRHRDRAAHAWPGRSRCARRRIRTSSSTARSSTRPARRRSDERRAQGLRPQGPAAVRRPLVVALPRRVPASSASGRRSRRLRR